MLIKINTIAYDKKSMADNLEQLPYLAMVQDNGHSIEYWVDGEQCPSHSYQPKGFKVLPISGRYRCGGWKAISVLHRYTATEKAPASAVLRHYLDIGNDSTLLVIDTKAKIDVGITRSLFSFLWLMPKGVRVEASCYVMRVKPFFDAQFAAYFPMKEATKDVSPYEAIREVENKTAAAGLASLISDTTKAIRRIQADLELYQIGRLNKLKEFNEVYPLLQRLPLGRFLAAFGAEPSPKDDPAPPKPNKPIPGNGGFCGMHQFHEAEVSEAPSEESSSENSKEDEIVTEENGER